MGLRHQYLTLFSRIIFPGASLCCTFLIAINSFAQSAKLSKGRQSLADSVLVREWLRESAHYLDKRGEAKSNLDSALLLATKAAALSDRIEYKKGRSGAAYLTGKVYIKSHSLRQLEELLISCDAETQARLMLDFVAYHTTFQGAQDSTLVTARRFTGLAAGIAEQLNSGELKSLALLQEANIAYYNQQSAEGKKYYLSALSGARKANQIIAEAEIFSQMSTYLKLNQDSSLLREMLAIGNEVLTVYDKITDPQIKEKIQSLITMGYDQLSYHYLYHGDLDLAYEYSLKMVKMLEAEGNPYLNEVPYQTLGKICLDLGKLNESIQYLKTAYAIVEKKGEIFDGSALKNITKAYIGLLQPQEALQFLDIAEARGGYDDLRNKKLIAESRGNCYLTLRQYEKAEKYLLESYEIGKQLGKEQIFVR
ncbi:MAG: hypothetical protein QM764_21095 [Chitinophagaceae bacterium]